MLNKRKLQDYIRRRRKPTMQVSRVSEPVLSDYDRAMLYTKSNKPDYTKFDEAMGFDEYLCKVRYTFYPRGMTHSHCAITSYDVHHIARGTTMSDVDAFLDTVVIYDIQLIEEALPGYSIGWDIVYIRKLLLED